MPGAVLGAVHPFPFQDALLSGGLAGVYLLLALAAFLKYTVPFLPGDAALLVGVFWIGVRHGSWGIAVVAIVSGGTLGAMAAYWWGHRFGKILFRFSKLAVAVERVEALLGRWGFWALVLNRFIPGARTLFLPAAGLLKMHPGRVAASVTAGNLLFALFLAGVGYSAGREFSELESLYHVYLTGLSSVMLFLAVGTMLYWFAAKALSARRERLEARAAAETGALP